MDHLSIKVGTDRPLEVRASHAPYADVVILEQQADMIVASVEDVMDLVEALLNVANHVDTHKVKQ
jgi:CMP-2-keto-3-deoxyoctulosonic acid synthetase